MPVLHLLRGGPPVPRVAPPRLVRLRVVRGPLGRGRRQRRVPGPGQPVVGRRAPHRLSRPLPLVPVFDLDGTLLDSDEALVAPFVALGVPREDGHLRPRARPTSATGSASTSTTTSPPTTTDAGPAVPGRRRAASASLGRWAVCSNKHPRVGPGRAGPPRLDARGGAVQRRLRRPEAPRSGARRARARRRPTSCSSATPPTTGRAPAAVGARSAWPAGTRGPAGADGDVVLDRPPTCWPARPCSGDQPRRARRSTGCPAPRVCDRRAPASVRLRRRIGGSSCAPRPARRRARPAPRRRGSAGVLGGRCSRPPRRRVRPAARSRRLGGTGSAAGAVAAIGGGGGIGGRCRRRGGGGRGRHRLGRPSRGPSGRPPAASGAACASMPNSAAIWGTRPASLLHRGEQGVAGLGRDALGHDLAWRTGE